MPGVDIRPDEIGTGREPRPPDWSKRPRPPSKYHVVVEQADKRAEDGSLRPDVVNGEDVLVGPWVHYPKGGEPIVGTQVGTKLRHEFGPNSDYCATTNGAYFEVKLSDCIRVRSSTGFSTQSKGVLHVRKVFPVKGDS